MSNVRLSYRISPPYLAAFVSVFVILTYVYACLAKPGWAGLTEAVHSLIGPALFYLLISSVALVSILDGVYRKSTYRPPVSLDGTARYLLLVCRCLFVAFLLEITVFQYAHYGTLWADAPLAMNSGEAQVVANKMTAERGAFMAGVRKTETGYESVPDSEGGDPPYLQFNNLNRRVASVHVAPNWQILNLNTFQLVINYADEDNSLRQTMVFTVVRGLPFTEYLPIYPLGKVSQITVIFLTPGAVINNVSINATIPLTPVLLRILLVAGLLLVIGTLRRYDLLAVRFNPESSTQQRGFLYTLVGFGVLCAILALLSSGNWAPSFGSRSFNFENQYNLMADAFVEGHLDIKLDGFEAIKNFDRPYDLQARMNSPVEYPHDVALYNGKFYSYFGVVPVVLTYLPFRALTGAHLPNAVAALIFGYLALLLVVLIYHHVARQYCRNMPYVVYWLGLVAVATGGGVLWNIVRPAQYEIAILAGVMFVAAGLLLLLKARESGQLSGWRTLLACTCLALAVGCRPTMVLFSAFVPLLLWHPCREAERMSQFKMLLTVVVPYIVVAVPLMAYNYSRFGNVAEFGATYQLTMANIAAIHAFSTPMNWLYDALAGIKGFLLNPPRLSGDFPFILPRVVPLSGSSYLYVAEGVIGYLWFPALWFLFALKARYAIIRQQSEVLAKSILLALALVLLLALVVPYVGGGVLIRYSTDTLWLMTLAALMVMLLGFFGNDKSIPGRSATMLISILLVVNTVACLLLSMANQAFGVMLRAPWAYYYLDRSFSWLSGM